MKRVSAVAASAAAICIAVPAQASSNPPAPTLDITTSARGQTLPASTMAGAWTVQRAGRRANLSVQGPVATGTVTEVRSSWTSAWRWAPRHHVAIYAGVENDFDDVIGSAEKNRVAVVIQVHRAGRRWQTVERGVMSHGSMLLTPTGFGFGTGLGMLDHVRLQWRVMMTAIFTDTSTEGLTETVRVA